jgi:hypothetical protein
MKVPIQHIIGTVALIGLMITTGLAYSVITSFIDTDIKQQQLKQISENVALNIVEMSNLIRFANYTNRPMMKILDLPIDLSGSTYTVQLVDGQTFGEGYYVRANLTTNEHTTATSLIPVSAGQNLVLNTTTATNTLIVGFDNTNITCSGVVSGKSEFVVWGVTRQELDPNDIPIQAIEVGIGWIT